MEYTQIKTEPIEFTNNSCSKNLVDSQPDSKNFIKLESIVEHCDICRTDLSITPYIKCDCGIRYCINCLVKATLDFSQCPKCYYVFTLDQLDLEFGARFQSLAFESRVQHYFNKTIETDKRLLNQTEDYYKTVDDYVEHLFRKFYVKIQPLNCPSIDTLITYIRECYNHYNEGKRLLKLNITERLDKLNDYINNRISIDEFTNYIYISIRVYWNLLYMLDMMFEIISWVHCYFYSSKTSLIRKYKTLGLTEITYLIKDYIEIVDKIYSYSDMIVCLNDHYQIRFPCYQGVY